MIHSLHEKAVSLSKHYHSLEAELLVVLEKIKDQKIYLDLGFESLFSYCVKALNLSESKAWSFSALLKKSKSVPEIKEEIKSGGLTLSKAARIVSVVTPENKTEWIEKAKTLPKQELEREVARENPQSIQRKKVDIISEKDVRLHLNIPREVYENLKKLQTLMSQKNKRNISIEETIEAMSGICLERLDPLKKAERAKNRKEKAELEKKSNLEESDLASGKISVEPEDSVTVQIIPMRINPKRRTLPAPLKHQLNLRDQGKCQFQSLSTGHKCESESFIEFHHIRPVSNGGSNELTNLITLCSKHHSHEHNSGHTN